MATPACPRRAPLLLIPDGDVDELRRRLLDLSGLLAALAATGPQDPPDALDDDPSPWERTAHRVPAPHRGRRVAAHLAEAVTHLAADMAGAQNGPIAQPETTGGRVLVPLCCVLLGRGHLDALAGPGPVGAVQQWESHGQRRPTVAGAPRALTPDAGGGDVEALASRLAAAGPVELGDGELDRDRRVTARWNADWHPAGLEHRRRRRRRQIRPGRPM
jgi:hypothetical protein